MNNYPIARHLVLVGGGHSHVILLKMLGMNPIPGLHVTMISPEISTPYSGMLPGLIAGHYARDEVYIDLVPLCRFAGVSFVKAAVTGIAPDDKEVQIEGRGTLSYDIVSIDIGSTPVVDDPSQLDVIAVKPIGELLNRWQSFLARVEQGGIHEIGFVGAGAGGVELCLAVNHALKLQGHDCRIHLFSDGMTLLADYPTGVRIEFERILADQNIELHREFRASTYQGGELVSLDGRAERLDEVFWVTQAGVQNWPGDGGLSVNDEGFIQIKDTLQAVSHDNVFAVGDCAIQVNHPRPRAGVYAVRQGKPLYNNIRSLLLGKKLEAHRPQTDFLSLISTGPKVAVASRNGRSVKGGWVWRWKNWIDQRFMQRFEQLPRMQTDPVNELHAEFDDQMQCGGCGSKVSSDLLHDTLSSLMDEDEVPVDDAAVIDVPTGSTLIQSVDHFRSMVSDPYLQARIAVCHAVSDIYACGGRGSSAMALLTLPFAKPDVTRGLLHQILSGTLDQLAEEKMTLQGGHTSEGIELSIGFAVNGLVDQGGMWRKYGAKPGDRLILTKPLGTGTIMAADMQYRAKGSWVDAAVTSMATSNRAAMEVLHDFDVHACTDITGFGLAGHMNEMAADRPIGVEISLKAIPRLEGADLCLGDLGIMSTLHQANRSAAALLDTQCDGAEILFDPQTSGGLLVAIPADEADGCLTSLREAGYAEAAIIGEVVSEKGIVIREV
jgi:selenide,water dikinase